MNVSSQSQILSAWRQEHRGTNSVNAVVQESVKTVRLLSTCLHGPVVLSMVLKKLL